MLLKKSIRNFWRLERLYVELENVMKTLMRTSSDGNILWWTVRSLGDSDQFCFLLMESHFQVLILLFVTCKNKQTTSNDKENVTYHSLRNIGLSWYYSTTISIWDKNFKSESKLLKNDFDELSIFNQRLSHFSPIQEHEQFEEIQWLRNFASVKILSKSNLNAFKHLENSYKLSILEFFSVRSFLSLKLVYHFLSSKV